MNDAVIAFARFPRAGKVKTRLAATIGDDAAAEFYKSCAEHLFKELAQLTATKQYLFFADREDAADMRGWVGEQFILRPQIAGDLGARMQQAFADVFADGAKKVVLVGSDIPDLSHRHIEEAFEMLVRCDVVLGPSHDGGYYLLGMKSLQVLFTGIAWSTEIVAAQTRALIVAAGLTCGELEMLKDVDTALP